MREPRTKATRPRKAERRRLAGRLAGRYQGWLAPFTLRWDSAARHFWRYFDLHDRLYTDPRSWSHEEVNALIDLGVWKPLAPGEDGADLRSLRRLFSEALARGGEELPTDPGPVAGWVPPKGISGGIVSGRRAPPKASLDLHSEMIRMTPSGLSAANARTSGPAARWRDAPA